MANQPLGFQQESWHASFWKATGHFGLSIRRQIQKSCRETAGTLLIEDGVV
jgi:hypothetical protein